MSVLVNLTVGLDCLCSFRDCMSLATWYTHNYIIINTDKCASIYLEHNECSVLNSYKA